LLKNDASFREISILDHQGLEVLKLSERKVYFPSDLRNEAASAPFREAIRGRVYLGPVRTSIRAEPYLTVALPLKLTPDKAVGVLIAQTDLKFLWQVIADATLDMGDILTL
jgi:hypothetical protein